MDMSDESTLSGGATPPVEEAPPPADIGDSSCEGSSPSPEAAPRTDVGFGPVSPSSDEEEREVDMALSEEFRKNVAKTIASLGRIVREIESLDHTPAAMKAAFVRTACVEAAGNICLLTEYEIENKIGEPQ
jgi:hypothetical protein